MKLITENQEEEEIPEGYTRVTEILQPFTKFEHIKPEVLQNAADRGKRVHKLCELYTLNLFIPYIDDDCNNYFENFCKWYDENVSKIILSEKRINCSDLKISGQIDMVVNLKGESGNTIIDIKTPATVSKNWQIQTAAYQYLCEYGLNISIQKRMCLMLPKKGNKIKICEYKNYIEDFHLFDSALKLYRFFNG